MKSEKFIVLICTLCSVLCTPIAAQTSALSIGVRGGGALWLSPSSPDPATTINSRIGGNGLVEFRYAYRSAVSSSFELGLNAGIGAGFGMSSFNGTQERKFVNTDYLGNVMDYTITADYDHRERFLQTEVSLLLALRASGFVLNIGPRLMLPLFPSGKTTITHADIDAYYSRYKVHVVNQLITGKLETPAVTDGAIGLPVCNLLIAVEAGWEWYVGDNQFGLQAFADIGVWTLTSSNPLTANPLIEVAPINDTWYPVAVVTTHHAEGFLHSGRLMQFGVRCYYAFSVGSQKKTYNYRRARDSHDHRNRYWWWN